MKITILCENQISHRASRTCLAEWGFSAFIEAGDIRILFDTGHSGIYKTNAEKLGVDLQKTDFVVLSHYHWDHVDGLQHHDFTDKKRLLCHPDLLGKLPEQQAGQFRADFEIVQSRQPYEMAKDVIYLGEIPRTTGFETGAYKSDPMLEDSAIAVKTAKGVVVISGCSHAGICNICEYAKKVTGLPLYAELGGFHLFEHDVETTAGTIAYFKSEKPEHLCPLHCVDFPTLSKLHSTLGIKKLSTGDEIQFAD
nr:MBL fold metallo-hydrolase [uncultured Cohaesibacter sp.]